MKQAVSQKLELHVIRRANRVKGNDADVAAGGIERISDSMKKLMF
jgi:hypothetical protein